MREQHGLADGFTAYLVPTPEDYTASLRTGLVVLDANVLLNAYRYHEPTRSDLFAILEALGDRLFVPHQAAKEFWKNREATIRGASARRISSETISNTLRTDRRKRWPVGRRGLGLLSRFLSS